jgi:predicted Zn-dependent protease
VLRKANGKVLPEGDPQVARVRQIGEKTIRAAQIEPLQMEINLNLHGYQFEPAFSVIEDRQVNAFCLPACKVCVFTGLLQLVQDFDNYLATVLGHEIWIPQVEGAYQAYNQGNVVKGRSP